MDPAPVKLTRQQLYKEVWTTPIHQLAGNYGLSDVGLAKVCKRMDVPRPYRGYWQRIRWGRAPKKLPLPPPDEGTVLQVELRERGAPAAPRPEPKAPRVPKLPPVFPEVLADPHPLVAASHARFAGAKQGPEGLLTLQAKRVLDLHVGPASLDRCLRLMDALIKSWEAEGLEVKLLKSDRRGDEAFSTCLCSADEHLSFSIREKVKEVDPGPTEEEKLQPKWQWKPRREFRATGELTFFMEGAHISPVTTFHRRYRDAPGAPIEEKLTRIWQAGVEYFEKRQAHEIEEQRRRAEREEERRQWELRWQREERERRRQEAEQQRVEALRKSAAAWRSAEDIRAFIKACHDHLQAQGSDADRIDKWVRWAQAVADRLDPLGSGYPNLNQRCLSPDSGDLPEEGELDPDDVP